MLTENISTLKIHKLTQAQYERELEAGRIDKNALYLTPDEEIDLSNYATLEQLDNKANANHNHDDMYYTEIEIDTKLSTVNTSITNITNGTTKVGKSVSADSLNTDAGSGTNPVFFMDGIPVATTYTLGKSVPSDAKFTDTTYSEATIDTAGLLSASDKIQLNYGGIPIVTTSGTGSDYTASVDGMDTLTLGMSFVMVPHTVSTVTSPTLNVNNLGVKTIRRRLTDATISTETGNNTSWLSAHKPIRVEFDGSFWIADLPKPSASDISGTIGVGNGGIGKTSVTANSFLVGNGTSAMIEKTPDEVLELINGVSVDDVNVIILSTSMFSPTVDMSRTEIKQKLSEGKIVFVFETFNGNMYTYQGEIMRGYSDGTTKYLSKFITVRTTTSIDELYIDDSKNVTYDTHTTNKENWTFTLEDGSTVTKAVLLG